MAYSKKNTFDVLLIDDEYQGLKSIIAMHPNASNEGELVNWHGNKINFKYYDNVEEVNEKIKFSEISADCVILDHQFTNSTLGKDGIWLLKRLINMCPELPIIFLSQYYEPQNAFSVGALQADKYIDKLNYFDENDPSRVEDLFTEIGQVIIRKYTTPELFDKEHRLLADSYADEGYDEGEQKFPATLAYYLFENEIIIKTIDAYIATDKEELKICDIGCGTGRIEELILSKYDLEELDIELTGIDFSGRMLRHLSEKSFFKSSKNLKIERGTAERLSMFKDNYFDFVIMGFGVPSYTKYYYSINEAKRICKEDGMCLFSVYNKNSINYDLRKFEQNDSPIAAVANVITGKLVVGNKREFDCETFSVDEIVKLINRFGFKELSVHTFPTIHAGVPNKSLTSLPDNTKKVTGFTHVLCHSPSLYELDKIISKTLSDRGHYILIVAQKINDEK